MQRSIWRGYVFTDDGSTALSRVSEESALYTTEHMVGVLAACELIMCNVDLVALVLSHAVVCLRRFAHWRCVSRVWKEACDVDESLLMRAAHAPEYLTKGTFMGLFGLTSAEADAFERTVCVGRKGLMYRYTAPAIDSVLPAICGFDQWWEVRLARQAAEKLVAHPCSGKRKRQRLSWLVDS